MKTNLIQEQLHLGERLPDEVNSNKDYFRPVRIEYAPADLKGGDK
jgi:hypothetical protein